MPEAKSIADRLRAARKKSGDLSQSQAAKEWGVGLKTLQAWEQGVANPRGLYLAKVEEILRKAGV